MRGKAATVIAANRNQLHAELGDILVFHSFSFTSIFSAQTVHTLLMPPVYPQIEWNECTGREIISLVLGACSLVSLVLQAAI